MIKIDHIPMEVKELRCVNCNRKTALNLKFSFFNNLGTKYNELTLCDDCANAVANLFYEAMEEGKSYKYDNDEIQEFKEEK